MTGDVAVRELKGGRLRRLDRMARIYNAAKTAVDIYDGVDSLDAREKFCAAMDDLRDAINHD